MLSLNNDGKLPGSCLRNNNERQAVFRLRFVSFMKNLTVAGVLQKSFLLLAFGSSKKQGKIVLPACQAILFDLSV